MIGYASMIPLLHIQLQADADRRSSMHGSRCTVCGEVVVPWVRKVVCQVGDGALASGHILHAQGHNCGSLHFIEALQHFQNAQVDSHNLFRMPSEILSLSLNTRAAQMSC